MNMYFTHGSTVLFQGDSVTDCSRLETESGLGEGYPAVFAQIYNTLFPHSGVRFVNRGVSGDRISDLIRRCEEDFIAVKPDYIFILIGINDVWRAFDCGEVCAAEEFYSRYETLLKRLRDALPNAEIILIEPFTVDGFDMTADWDGDLTPKREAVKRLAGEYADKFIPMHEIFLSERKWFSPSDLSCDGVHPVFTGHALIARKLLHSLGII